MQSNNPSLDAYFCAGFFDCLFIISVMPTAFSSNYTQWSLLLFVIIGIALSSSAPWVIDQLMPDMFSSAMYLAIAIIILFFNRLSTLQKIALFVILTISMVCHVSNIMLGLSLLGIFFLLEIIIQRKLASTYKPYLFIGLALLFSISLLIGSNAINKDPRHSLMRASNNFLLAKVISDGPGLIFLNENCNKVALKTCSILDQLNQFKKEHPEAILSEYFLWSGIINQAGGWDVINDEAAWIVRKSVKQNPAMQLKALAKNSLEQLITFQAGEGLRSYAGDNIFTGHMIKIAFPNQYSQFLASRQSLSQNLFATNLNLIYTTIICVSCIGLLLLLFIEKSREDVSYLIISCFIFIAMNAMFTGGLSAISHRYESRVIWLLPCLFYLFLFARCFKQPKKINALYRMKLILKFEG